MTDTTTTSPASNAVLATLDEELVQVLPGRAMLVP